MDEFEKFQEQNLKELESFLATELTSTEYKEAVQLLSAVRTSAPTKRKTNKDDKFRFTGAIPLEKRSSSRLKNKTPQYNYDDLPEERPTYGKRARDEDFDDIEEVVYIKKRKSMSRWKSMPVPAVPVDEIDEKYLDLVAHKSTKKIYSQDGTSCHQCRQKTLDSKTYCRSGRCIGVRGQFCGPCLMNRYGEDARVVLLDPDWECPPCRGLCNCSICRTREGKRPTGILAPIAQQYGYGSVKEFLESLKGKGDYDQSDSDSSDYSTNKKRKKLSSKSKPNLSDPDTDDELEYLLGFDSNKQPVSEVPPKPKTVTNNDDYSDGDLLGFDEKFQPVVIKSEE